MHRPQTKTTTAKFIRPGDYNILEHKVNKKLHNKRHIIWAETHRLTKLCVCVCGWMGERERLYIYLTAHQGFHFVAQC